VFMCVVFVADIARGSVSTGSIAVAAGALCLAIAILGYKAEADRTEVRIRYAPFLTRRALIRDVTHVVEKRTLVLVTPTSELPLWVLTAKDREKLFQILPQHLELVASSARMTDAAASLRKHLYWTVIAAVGFLLSFGLVIPFFKGNAWHGYWNSVGQYVLLLCLLFFIALIFEAGFTWVSWSTKRDADRIENRHVHRQH
jgi:hypothetical protein